MRVDQDLPNETWTNVLAQGFVEEPCRWIMSDSV